MSTDRQGLASATASRVIGSYSDLLERRADVRRADRTLAAAVARIGAAEAKRYPRITISGTVALRDMELSTLLDGAGWLFRRRSR